MGSRPVAETKSLPSEALVTSRSLEFCFRKRKVRMNRAPTTVDDRYTAVEFHRWVFSDPSSCLMLATSAECIGWPGLGPSRDQSETAFEFRKERIGDARALLQIPQITIAGILDCGGVKLKIDCGHHGGEGPLTSLGPGYRLYRAGLDGAQPPLDFLCPRFLDGLVFPLVETLDEDRKSTRDRLRASRRRGPAYEPRTRLSSLPCRTRLRATAAGFPVPTLPRWPRLPARRDSR